MSVLLRRPSLSPVTSPGEIEDWQEWLGTDLMSFSMTHDYPCADEILVVTVNEMN